MFRFVGDSVARQLFLQYTHVVDPKSPDTSPDDDHKHSNCTADAENKVKVPSTGTCAWTRHIRGRLTPPMPIVDRLALLILGTGLWRSRYEDYDGLFHGKPG